MLVDGHFAPAGKRLPATFKIMAICEIMKWRASAAFAAVAATRLPSLPYAAAIHIAGGPSNHRLPMDGFI